MSIDLQITTLLFFLPVLIGIVFFLSKGTQKIQSSAALMFYADKHQLILKGWANISIAILLGVVSVPLYQFGEPVLHDFLKPTLDPASVVAQIPQTILTPTQSQRMGTPNSPVATKIQKSLPTFPQNIPLQFIAQATPNPDAVFSSPMFAKAIENGQPINPTTTFIDPAGELYSTFSYDKMAVGSQWTALWIRSVDQTVICVDSKAWDGSTGGYGYSVCKPPNGQWLAGNYEVQIFTGKIFKVSSNFTVKSLAPSESNPSG